MTSSKGISYEQLVVPLLVGDREHTCVASKSCRIFSRDQSVHFRSTTAWKGREIRITRCEKSRFYPELAKIRINRRFL